MMNNSKLDQFETLTDQELMEIQGGIQMVDINGVLYTWTSVPSPIWEPLGPPV